MCPECTLLFVSELIGQVWVRFFWSSKIVFFLIIGFRSLVDLSLMPVVTFSDDRDVCVLQFVTTLDFSFASVREPRSTRLTVLKFHYPSLFVRCVL